MPEPQIECPLCFHRIGLNTYAASGSPRVNTHKLVAGEFAGEECPGSRVWVSQETYDKAARKPAFVEPQALPIIPMAYARPVVEVQEEEANSVAQVDRGQDGER